MTTTGPNSFDPGLLAVALTERQLDRDHDTMSALIAGTDPPELRLVVAALVGGLATELVDHYGHAHARDRLNAYRAVILAQQGQ